MTTDLITETGLLTVAEAAKLVRKSERTWRMWHSAGLVPKPIRIGRSIFWRAEEFARVGGAWVSGSGEVGAFEVRDSLERASPEFFRAS